MIAIPDFYFGATENWGLIAYRETRILNSENTSESLRKDICITVAHELSHQWFGNLVTMDWWRELWLNEGFATHVEYTAANVLYPKWKMWNLFLAREFSRAMEL